MLNGRFTLGKSLAMCLASSLMFTACGDTAPDVSGQPYIVDGNIVLLQEGAKSSTIDLEVDAQVSFGRAGTRLLFGAERQVREGTDEVVGFNLWSVAADGSGARRVVEGQKVLGAMWSPEHEGVIYSTTDMEVYLLKDGKAQLLVGRATSPALSPDGTRLAYAKLPASWEPGAMPGAYDLHVLDLKSGEDVALTQGYDDAEPMWAPDGKSLLFLSGGRTSLTSLWRVEADGGKLAQVTNVGRTMVDASFVLNPSSNTEVHWSADGKRLLYGAHYSIDGEVMVLEFNDARELSAVRSLGKGLLPRWTSDGDVVMAQQSAGKVTFVEASATGGQVRELGTANGELGQMATTVASEPAPDADVGPMTAACDKDGVTALHGTTPRFRWPLSYWPGYSAYYDNNASAGYVKDWKCGTNTYDGHLGTDILASQGSSIYCGDGGFVSARNDGCATVGYVNNSCGGGFGNYVRVNHNSTGWHTIYAHMTNGTVNVALNQTVYCGTLLGKSGSSGNSSGYHLHFEVLKYQTPGNDPFAGSCSGPESFWTNQNGGQPVATCHSL